MAVDENCTLLITTALERSYQIQFSVMPRTILLRGRGLSSLVRIQSAYSIPADRVVHLSKI